MVRRRTPASVAEATGKALNRRQVQMAVPAETQDLLDSRRYLAPDDDPDAARERMFASVQAFLRRSYNITDCDFALGQLCDTQRMIWKLERAADGMMPGAPDFSRTLGTLNKCRDTVLKLQRDLCLVPASRPVIGKDSGKATARAPQPSPAAFHPFTHDQIPTEDAALMIGGQAGLDYWRSIYGIQNSLDRHICRFEVPDVYSPPCDELRPLTDPEREYLRKCDPSRLMAITDVYFDQDPAHVDPDNRVFTE